MDLVVERGENLKKLLIVVDMQNDFIDGSLGTPEAQAIVPKVVEKIQNWDGDIVYTQDTHDRFYLNSNEGKHLPITHCVYQTHGWKVENSVQFALDSMDEIITVRYDDGSLAYTYHKVKSLTKHKFGSVILAEDYCLDYDTIVLCGLCTDICVIANALLVKSFQPEANVIVDASCCAGTTKENHEAALKVMRSCQIDIV